MRTGFGRTAQPTDEVKPAGVLDKTIFATTEPANVFFPTRIETQLFEKGYGLRRVRLRTNCHEVSTLGTTALLRGAAGRSRVSKASRFGIALYAPSTDLAPFHHFVGPNMY